MKKAPKDISFVKLLVKEINRLSDDCAFRAIMSPLERRQTDNLMCEILILERILIGMYENVKRDEERAGETK